MPEARGGRRSARHVARRRRRVLAAVGAAVAITVAGCSAPVPGPPPASSGVVQHRVVPPVTLVDEQGRSVSLASLRGRAVFLVPFLTLCQEVCPMTTADTEAVWRALQSSGLERLVTVAAVTVDPGRDSPARLAAYAHLTGAGFPMYSGTPGQLATLWSFLGVSVQQVPEGNPPGIDWMTHQPLTYDVDHSDGFVLIDASGVERFATAAMPTTCGHLAPVLRGLLDQQGIANLTRPQGPTWDAQQALDAIGWLVHRPVPSVPCG